MYYLKIPLVFIAFCLFFLVTQGILAQDVEKLHTARGYWFEEQNERYQLILKKIDNDQHVSPAEEQWYEEYHAYLKKYFSSLNDLEKEKYFENKEAWDKEKAGIVIEQTIKPTPEVDSESLDVLETNAKGIQPGKKYLMYNGIYGFMYGLGIIAIVEPMDATALAIPLTTTGLGLLWPVLNKKRYENIPYNSVLLARHGKFIGGVHGAALGLTAFGTESTAAGKGIVAMAIAGSLAGSEIGYRFGKTKDWTEGQVVTYKYYGLLVPAIGFFSLAAGRVDNPRVYGATILASGAAGYFLGNKVGGYYDNTRGDILALGSFTALSTMLTIAFVDFEQTTDLIAPISGAIAGTFVGHTILKDKKLTAKEGWRVNYVTGAGLLLGLGVAVLTSTEAEHHAPFIILPVVGGGLGWYGMLRSSLRNRETTAATNNEKWSYLSMNFTPENYLINKAAPNSIYSNIKPTRPVIGLTLNF